MFKHCYIPRSMINSVIIPLIKSLRVNVMTRLINNNNYRPIALSSSTYISKVFENIIAERFEVYRSTNPNQFRFRSGYSTDLSIYAFI